MDFPRTHYCAPPQPNPPRWLTAQGKRGCVCDPVSANLRYEIAEEGYKEGYGTGPYTHPCNSHQPAPPTPSHTSRQPAPGLITSSKSEIPQMYHKSLTYCYSLGKHIVIVLGSNRPKIFGLSVTAERTRTIFNKKGFFKF